MKHSKPRANRNPAEMTKREIKAANLLARRMRESFERERLKNERREG